jgi:hypothetical protein
MMKERENNMVAPLSIDILYIWYLNTNVALQVLAELIILANSFLRILCWNSYGHFNVNFFLQKLWGIVTPKINWKLYIFRSMPEIHGLAVVVSTFVRTWFIVIVLTRHFTCYNISHCLLVWLSCSDNTLPLHGMVLLIYFIILQFPRHNFYTWCSNAKLLLVYIFLYIKICCNDLKYSKEQP